MHVVNDKQPGTLMFVMTRATGLQARNLALFILAFQVDARLIKEVYIASSVIGSRLKS